MRLKSYFADTVEAAMTLARQELGEEAMLVYAREASPEASYLGRQEVVFGLEPDPEAAARETPPLDGSDSRPIRPAASPADGFARIERELGGLRRQLERALQQLYESRFSGEHDRIYQALVAADFAPEVAAGLVGRLLGKRAQRNAGAGVRLALQGVVRLDPDLGGRAPWGRRVVALVGPPGSGKTTVLVKLAVQYGLKSRRPVYLLSLDTHRIAAAEQLRTYASILGVGFTALETPAALAPALEEHRQKDLILIDTPGFAPAEADEAAELAEALAAQPEIDVHLTLSAAIKPADVRGVVDRFERFRPAKLLLTRMDETGTCGALLSEAVRSGKPISFLSCGQRIPEDLVEATVERLADRIAVPGAEADASGEGWQAPPAPSRFDGAAAGA